MTNKQDDEENMRVNVLEEWWVDQEGGWTMCVMYERKKFD